MEQLNMEKVFVKLVFDETTIGMLKYDNEKDFEEDSELMVELIDRGISLVKIDEQEYEAWDLGDEMTTQDLRDGNYYIED
jgi:hypothetical protein